MLLLLLLLLLQVIAVPEIRHVTLPTTGGRLVIASDGVWDHMQPKSMIHQASAAAAASDAADAAAKASHTEAGAALHGRQMAAHETAAS
jgi:serine/threonine protein phosphatase PrpC